MSRRASDWPGCLVPKRRDPVQPLRDQRAVEGADADRVLAGLVRVVAEVPKGTRNSRLYWAAARLAEHAAAGRVPLDVGAAALFDAAAQAALPEVEADRTSRSALRGAA